MVDLIGFRVVEHNSFVLMRDSIVLWLQLIFFHFMHVSWFWVSPPKTSVECPLKIMLQQLVSTCWASTFLRMLLVFFGLQSSWSFDADFILSLLDKQYSEMSLLCLQAGVKAILEGYTRYTPNAGTLELRKAICHKLQGVTSHELFDWGMNVTNVIWSCSSLNPL